MITGLQTCRGGVGAARHHPVPQGQGVIIFVVVIGAAPSIANGSSTASTTCRRSCSGRPVLGARGSSLVRLVVIPAALPRSSAG